MRKITLYLLLGICFLACKKEDVIVVNPSQREALKIDTVINDSTLVLTWRKFTGTHFKQYRIARVATYLKNDKFAPVYDSVFTSTDINVTSFTETNMPLAKDINYYLIIDRDTVPSNSQAPGVTYQRPHSVLSCQPTDVLFSKAQKKLYIIEQQKIHIVDISGRPLLSKEFPTTIGYCTLGTYNGSNELYVPLNDGWVEILDAATLELKDRIYVAGFGIGSVLALNGKLYVSSSDNASSGYADCVKIFDRASKTLVARTGYYDQTRLVALEGTAVEMIDLTIHQFPISLFYYSFTTDGIPLVKKEDTYHMDYTMDPAIVRSFPDGSRFITSGSGNIFNKSLVFDRYLKQYPSNADSYTDFAFNSDGSIIYAANGPLKKIDIFRYPSTTNTGNYPTKFTPYKLFRDDNSLISVSKASSFQQTFILIENIKL
ncbi:hypothetical protein A4H97_23730 [Niastella yeongjuensis]|uniref:Fibronectin type-III domain-containing protein n=1 Tax=Niastella yeongjuensis TaxID=354355 RepID=A0A1V9F510_9BACT|nr:hypothetical protein [Niastella yeongjuensis]OQP53458.1 hypothetical protein A4H97_23730 [Niastella yeongjuensis]SEP11736.1 hypothetical protein SAMN05660816_04454 [Niastella yeongjuensis]